MKRAWSVLVAASAVALAHRPAGAQTLRSDCTPEGIAAIADLAPFGARARFHPNASAVRDSTGALSDPVAALGAVRADFGADPGLASGDPIRRALAAQLDSAIMEVTRARDSAFVVLRDRGDTVLARLAWGRVMQTRFKPGFDEEIELHGVPAIGATLPAEARQAACWTARRASRILEQLAGPVYTITARALTATLRDWDRYDREGLSQYPWEAALNGRKRFCPLPVQGPPTCQWVLLHPSLGYAVRASGEGDDVSARLRGRQAIVVDVIGKVNYRDGWRSYRGWSLFALLGNQPPGAGVTLHLDRAVQVGAGVGARSSGRWDRGVGYLSLDAYRWAAEMPAKLREKRDVVRAMRDRIEGGGEAR